MNVDSVARVVSALLDLIDDFVSEFRTKMIATHLIRSVSSTAARYRRRNAPGAPASSPKCVSCSKKPTNPVPRWNGSNATGYLAG
jgi:hypothetical protein